MSKPDFKIQTIEYPRACINCALCDTEIFTNNHICRLNRYISEIDHSVNFRLYTPSCMTCPNFLPFETAARLDGVGSLEEFRLLTSVGAWENASEFVLECKLNSFLCDSSATAKQIKYAVAISRRTGKVPPTTISGQMNPSGDHGNYFFEMANSKNMLAKYIGDNVDEFKKRERTEELSLIDVVKFNVRTLNI